MIKVKNMIADIFVLGSCLLSFTCNSPTGLGANAQPGRRDYVWTIDTIYSPNNLFSTIYGAAPNDVWLGGHGGPPRERLWHYDGVKWMQAQSPSNYNVESLFGFSANDIWLGSDEGKIFHYDGSTWVQNFVYKPLNSDPEITGIFGISPTNIYAIGSLIFYNSDSTGRGFILHNNGNGWQAEYLAPQGLQFAYILQEGSKVFLFAAVDKLLFFQYSNNLLVQIFSANRGDIGGGNMISLGGKVYFLVGNRLDRYEDENFVTVATFNINTSNFGYQLYGRNEKDVFLIMDNGIEHYNGTDIQYLYHLPTTSPYIFARSLIFENDVFFVLDYTDTSDFSKLLILRGKLTN